MLACLSQITGLVIMAVGVAIQSSYHHYSNFVGNVYGIVLHFQPRN